MKIITDKILINYLIIFNTVIRFKIKENSLPVINEKLLNLKKFLKIVDIYLHLICLENL